MDKDLREHSRVDVSLEADVGVAPVPDYSELLMANLSLGGCFIRTDVPEPPGALVMLRFALPGAVKDHLVRAVGRVCWTRDGRTSPPGMGLQFVRIEEDDLRELSNYIAGLLDSDIAAPESFEIEAEIDDDAHEEAA